jgi:hypothetical protein
MALFRGFHSTREKLFLLTLRGRCLLQLQQQLVIELFRLITQYVFSFSNHSTFGSLYLPLILSLLVR